MKKYFLAIMAAINILIPWVQPVAAEVPVSLPAGAGGALGAYVLAALAAVGIIDAGQEMTDKTILGQDNIKFVEAVIANKMTQNVKDSLTASYNTFYASGEQTMTLTTDVVDWLKLNVNPILGHFINTTTTVNGNYTVTYQSGNYRTYYLTQPDTAPTVFFNVKYGFKDDLIRLDDKAPNTPRTVDLWFQNWTNTSVNQIPNYSTGFPGVEYDIPYDAAFLKGSLTTYYDITSFITAHAVDTKIISRSTFDLLKSNAIANQLSTSTTIAVPKPTDFAIDTAGDWSFPVPQLKTDEDTGTKSVVVPIGGIETNVKTGEATTTPGDTTDTPTDTTGFWESLLNWINGFWDKFVELMKSLFIPTAIDFSPIQNVWVNRFPAVDSITSALGSLGSVTADTAAPSFKWKIGGKEYVILDLSLVDPSWIQLAKTFMRIMLWSSLGFMILRELRPKPTIG